jgi:hypothetical protein
MSDFPIQKNQVTDFYNFIKKIQTALSLVKLTILISRQVAAYCEGRMAYSIISIVSLQIQF